MLDAAVARPPWAACGQHMLPVGSLPSHPRPTQLFLRVLKLDLRRGKMKANRHISGIKIFFCLFWHASSTICASLRSIKTNYVSLFIFGPTPQRMALQLRDRIAKDGRNLGRGILKVDVCPPELPIRPPSQIAVDNSNSRLRRDLSIT